MPKVTLTSGKNFSNPLLSNELMKREMKRQKLGFQLGLYDHRAFRFPPVILHRQPYQESKACGA